MPPGRHDDCIKGEIIMFGLGKKNAAIDAFASEICTDLHTRFPPSRETELGGDRKRVGVTLGNALSELERRVAEFQSSEDLGVYGKARLLRSVGDNLSRLKYSESFVKATTDLLIKATAVGTK